MQTKKGHWSILFFMFNYLPYICNTEPKIIETYDTCKKNNNHTLLSAGRHTAVRPDRRSHKPYDGEPACQLEPADLHRLCLAKEHQHPQEPAERSQCRGRREERQGRPLPQPTVLYQPTNGEPTGERDQHHH